MKNAKNEGFLTNTQLEIHCNYVSKIFQYVSQLNWGPFDVQINVILESKIFQQDWIRGILCCNRFNFRELYLLIHQY